MIPGGVSLNVVYLLMLNKDVANIRALKNLHMTVREAYRRPGVGNTFSLAGHIGNKIGLCGPVSVSY